MRKKSNFGIDNGEMSWYNIWVSCLGHTKCKFAPVAELADALDLGSSVPDVKVQVLSGAPNSRNPNPLPIGTRFGFLLYFDYSSF